MSWWPWSRRPETRAGYADILLSTLASRADSPDPLPTATGALEAAAGFVSRAFMSAEIEAAPAFAAPLTPDCLALIGRCLVRTGEIVLLIDMRDGDLMLLPAQTHDVTGGADPRTWRYTMTLPGPSEIRTVTAPAEAVVHIQYARDVSRPWAGFGPVQQAALAGRLSAATAKALADESGMPTGGFLPLPIPGDDPTTTKLKQDIATLAGEIATVEAGNWGGAAGGGMASWKVERVGADPPAALVELATVATGEIYSACGLSPSLFGDGDGTAQRESYRRALFTVIAPLGRIVSAELSRKFETDVRLNWTELRASDVSGRARAFQSLVGGGMGVAEAAALAGLVVADE